MPFLKLLEGYKSFCGGENAAMVEELARSGQSPETMVIACSDSRADPAIITNSGPGEIFVVRNVAAIVPPYKSDSLHHGTSAAIEFAVKALKVKHIVVMGHSMCGGIEALAAHETVRNKYEFLTPWVAIGNDALEAVERELPNASREIKRRVLEQAVTLVSLDNLMTFPWIAEAVADKRIQLHGWHFDLKTGRLTTYHQESGDFQSVEQDKAFAG